MNNLLGLLTSSLTSQTSVDATAKKTGLNTKSVMAILSFALPMIMKAMTNNASTGNGAASLLSALGQHSTKKSIPDQIAEADQADGEKILRHIFGSETDNAMGEIAKGTGSSTKDVTSVLSTMAPTLLSTLSTVTGTASGKTGKVNLSDGIDASDILALAGGSSGVTNLVGSLLGGNNAQSSNKNDGTALLGSLLSLIK